MGISMKPISQKREAVLSLRRKLFKSISDTFTKLIFGRHWVEQSRVALKIAQKLISSGNLSNELKIYISNWILSYERSPASSVQVNKYIDTNIFPGVAFGTREMWPELFSDGRTYAEQVKFEVNEAIDTLVKNYYLPATTSLPSVKTK